MVIAGLWLASPGAAQPAFEVASIRPAAPDARERSLSQMPGARLSTMNASLRMLILLGYQVMPYQLSGGPGWLESDGFDIEARSGNPKATQGEFRQMIRTLLAERFHMQAHTATQEMPVYLLTVARNGTKLTEDRSDAEASMRNEGGGRMTGVKATLPMLAAALTRVLGRKVVDQSGLTGAYTFKLQFAPDQKAAPPGDELASHAAGDGPSVFSALEEQLGLSLKAGRGPVEVLVIDRAEKPSAN
jgi:uncharacterized protein (TIGR03435 family)